MTEEINELTNEDFVRSIKKSQRTRLMKGQIESGEDIVALRRFVDLTQKQFGALIKSLVPAIDLNFKRLTEAIETGEDPGEATPQSVAGASGLPAELRALLAKIGKAKGKDRDDVEAGRSFPKV